MLAKENIWDTSGFCWMRRSLAKRGLGASTLHERFLGDVYERIKVFADDRPAMVSELYAFKQASCIQTMPACKLRKFALNRTTQNSSRMWLKQAVAKLLF